MDQELFKKHLLVLHTIQKTQEELCNYIQKETGIILTPKEIHIIKKTVTLDISSVKRSILVQKNISSLLQKKGYRYTQ